MGEKGLDGIPMEGMSVEMDRVGWGSDTWKKTINVRIVNTQIFLRIVQCKPTRPSGHLVPK